MGSDERKKENGNEPKSLKGWIALCIPCFLAFVGVVYKAQIDVKLQKMKEEHEERMHEIQNEQEQSFYCDSGIVNKFGIEYKQYEIISKPIIEGYHVLVYPYIVSGKEMNNKVYDIGDGQLVESEKELVIGVLKAWESEVNEKIDLRDSAIK